MKKWLVGAGIVSVAVLAALPLTAPAAPQARTVSVTLKEFQITGVPAKLKQGATTFRLKNTGKFPHNLVAIFGPVGFKSSQIKPGKSGSVSANLKPGAYILICGVGAGYHASQGMIARFTVGTFDFTTNKWKA